MARTAAWPKGLRTKAACSMPGRWMSSTKRPLPRSRSWSSTRSTRLPRTVTSRAPLGFHALGRVEHGRDDALVSGAAAEIARDGDADVVIGRIGVVAQELDQCRQHARRAEAALKAVVLAERLL